MVSARTSMVLFSAFSTVCFFVIAAILPMFFLRMQRANTLMFTQLHKCHQDTNDIWRQLSQSKLLGRTRRQYKGSEAGPPAPPTGQCCSCQQGPPGPPGPKGKAMPPGKDGLIGINGRNGRNGRYVLSEARSEPPCQKCPQAPPGPPGHPGRKGPRGPAGNAGKNGSPATPGRGGPPGPQGVRGPPGEPGSQGPPGDSGKVLNGAPPGPAGRSGPAGPRGKPGAGGVDGRPGLTGPRGTRGPQGERGSKGALGAPGPHGAPGLVGQPGTCSHCQTKSQRPSTNSPSRVPASAVPSETSDSGYGDELPSHSSSRSSNSATPVSGRPAPPSRSPPVPQQHQTRVAASPARPAPPLPSAYDIPPAHFISVTTTHKPPPARNSYQAPPHSNYDSSAYSGPARAYGARPVQAETVAIFGDDDEPIEPFTPEPNQPRKPVGYSRDQLHGLSPAIHPESVAKFQQPTVVRTHKGYNVQLVGSSYSANPVGKSWDASTPTQYNPAHYQQLAPPAPRY